jgi:hypothetical protein
MRNISQDKAKAVRLRVPTLDEQRRIVARAEAQLSRSTRFVSQSNG